MSDLIRVNVYESDPLQMWASPATDYDDHYELPAHLLTDFQRAEVALDRARMAITTYIKEHSVVKVSPWDGAA